jgi:hypothetical protein
VLRQLNRRPIRRKKQQLDQNWRRRGELRLEGFNCTCVLTNSTRNPNAGALHDSISEVDCGCNLTAEVDRPESLRYDSPLFFSLSPFSRASWPKVLSIFSRRVFTMFDALFSRFSRSFICASSFLMLCTMLSASFHRIAVLVVSYDSLSDFASFWSV